jgi:hypothetical protein
MNAYRTWQSAFVFWSTMARAPAVVAMRLMAPPRARPAVPRAGLPVARAPAPLRQLTIVPPPVAKPKADPLPAHASTPEVELGEALSRVAMVEPSPSAIAPALAPEPEAVLDAVPERDVTALEDVASPTTLAVLAAPRAEADPDDLMTAAMRPLVTADAADPVQSALDAAIAEVVPKPPRAARRSAAPQKGRPRQGS